MQKETKPAGAGTIVNQEIDKPKSILVDVQRSLDSAMTRGLAFPPGYSVANAMASAKNALFAMGAIDINGQPKKPEQRPSIMNAVYDMAVQGLNPAKKQGYFIDYGGVISWQRSYFGDQALAERVKPNIQIYGDVILEGEKFVPRKVRSLRGLITVVEVHEMAWPVRDMKKIVGCYVGAVEINPLTGEAIELGIELMTFDQIKTSWKKSKTYGKGNDTFHTEQPDQACLRTVIRRWAKPIYNSSDDMMLMESIKRQELDANEAEIEEEVAANANKGPALELPQNGSASSVAIPATETARTETAAPVRMANDVTGETTQEERTGGKPPTPEEEAQQQQGLTF